MFDRHRPTLDYNPPSQKMVPDAGPWRAAGTFMLTSVAVTFSIAYARRPEALCLLIAVLTPAALLGIGLFVGSDWCRWITIVLTLFGHSAATYLILIRRPIPLLVQHSLQYVLTVQALSLAASLLMLSRQPRGARGLIGFTIAVVLNGIGYWQARQNLWPR